MSYNEDVGAADTIITENLERSNFFILIILFNFSIIIIIIIVIIILDIIQWEVNYITYGPFHRDKAIFWVLFQQGMHIFKIN